MANTHTVMPHKLAKALMEAGMQHFDSGGLINSVGGLITPTSGFQAGIDPNQKYNYKPTIGTAQQNALSGFGTSQNIQAQQQNLANALLARSQGNGPNPAQAALNANTGTNVANEAALIASSRGASANPALMAREAALAGTNAQQQAVGQSATLQAEQEIAAQQALAQQQAAMASGNLAEQNVNAGLFGTSGQLNNAQNANDIAAQKINAETAIANAGNEQKSIGGLFGGIGSLGSIFGGGSSPAAGLGIPLGIAAKGGEVGHLETIESKGLTHLPDHLHKIASIYHPEFTKKAMDFKSGGHVPGKAKVKGNSYDNDTVAALLSPGEEVLPRSITQSKNAPQKAYDFVRHLQDKKDEPKGYEKVAKAKMSLKSRVDRLEKMCMGGKV